MSILRVGVFSMAMHLLSDVASQGQLAARSGTGGLGTVGRVRCWGRVGVANPAGGLVEPGKRSPGRRQAVSGPEAAVACGRVSFAPAGFEHPHDIGTGARRGRREQDLVAARVEDNLDRLSLPAARGLRNPPRWRRTASLRRLIERRIVDGTQEGSRRAFRRRGVSPRLDSWKVDVSVEHRFAREGVLAQPVKTATSC
jgi:hypothetical protein